jgi:hypothetical protein
MAGRIGSYAPGGDAVLIAVMTSCTRAITGISA